MVFKKWRKHMFAWRETFPELPQDKSTGLDMISDLMKVDIGVLLRTIQRQDSKYQKFGLIPHLASCYLGRVMAESFA